MKIKIILAILLFIHTSMVAQTNVAEVKIKTSALCETCKETIEHNLSFEKGVKTVKVDLDTKMVNVTFNPAKTNEEKLRVALTKIGYAADSLPANPKAYDKLPDCCKMPGTKHH